MNELYTSSREHIEDEIQTSGFEVRSSGDHVSLGCVDCGATLAVQLFVANLDSFVTVAEEHKPRCSR